jgi:serine protease
MVGKVIGVVSALALGACASVALAARPTGTAQELLPDLDQEIPSHLQVVADPSRSGGYVLGFDSAVRNVGEGALVLQGRRAASEPRMAVNQVIARADGSSAIVPGVGAMQYVTSPTHQHWHYLAFDRYQLRKAGSPTALVRDQKTGFCLGDRYRVVTRAVANASPAAVYIGRCGLGHPELMQMEEGISVGYGDIYQAFLEFQSLRIDGLANGRYVLVHQANLDRRIKELNYANDASSVLLDLRWRNAMPYLTVLRVCPDSAVCDTVPSKAAAPKAAAPKARTSGDPFIPNDLGTGSGWGSVQWNFGGPFGVDAPAAWSNLIAVGAPGGSGVTVAVLDTGLAYADQPPFRRSPDLAGATVVPGWDFIDNDAYPFDQNGHGTDVASTIAEDTNNGFGLTGLAYGARIMPLRVLDARGGGNAATISKGVRFAVDHGANVINLSVSFDPSVTAAQITPLISALKYAAAHNVLVIGAAGNEGAPVVDFPARSRYVVAVGATTEFGCVASYSNHSLDLDLVAPGGGGDAAIQDANCVPGRSGRPIYQMTYAGRVDRFGIGVGYIGTSMAVPHVAATAALIIASGVLGRRPTIAQIGARLRTTARDLGSPGYDTHYGWGLVSAAAATASVVPGPTGSSPGSALN